MTFLLPCPPIFPFNTKPRENDLSQTSTLLIILFSWGVKCKITWPIKSYQIWLLPQLCCYITSFSTGHFAPTTQVSSLFFNHVSLPDFCLVGCLSLFLESFCLRYLQSLYPPFFQIVWWMLYYPGLYYHFIFQIVLLILLWSSPLFYSLPYIATYITLLFILLLLCPRLLYRIFRVTYISLTICRWRKCQVLDYADFR